MGKARRPGAPLSRRRFIAGGAAPAAALSAPPVAPAEAQAGERRLLPRELLFGDPDVTWARLSPDGASVAYIAPVDGMRNLWAAPIGDLSAARPLTRATDRPVGSYFRWAFTNRHIVVFQERDGDENWRASGVDVAGGAIVPLTPERGVRAYVQEAVTASRRRCCSRTTRGTSGSSICAGST